MPPPVRNPYPYYESIRADRVHWDDSLQRWTVTNYDDVAAALAHPGLSSHRPRPNLNRLGAEAREQAQSVYDTLSTWLLRLDAPAHTRLRTLTMQALRSSDYAALSERINQKSESLIGAKRHSGQMEVISEFARPLAVAAIGAFIGLPPEHQSQFQLWADAVGAAAEGEPEARRIAYAHRSLCAANDYLLPLLSKTPAPQESGLLAGLRRAETKNGRLSTPEVAGITTLILLAGYETACHSLANGLLALLQHPDQLSLLRADPQLAARAATEVIRYDSPLQGVLRVAAHDLELGGKQIKQGQSVVLWLAAANRDSAQFADPGRFHIMRKSVPHLAFGHGIHACLAAALGSLTIATGLNCLLAQPGLRFASPGPEWQGNFLFRCQRSLRIYF
jgi:cytochrome P450